MAKKTGIPTIDADSEKLEQLEARSDKAKGLVGKLFKLPHADGYAYYTVEEEKGQKVRVVNQALLDAWQDNILGPGGWFPRKQIEPIIRREEGMAKIFEDASKRQKSEREQVAEIVGAAALADLGAAADVYDLASWAWKRSFRGGVKDPRILKEGARAPWANDIAAALADSGRFPAIDRLNDKVIFIMLADKVQDPIVYANEAPSDDIVLGKVMEAFQKAVGTDRVYNLKVVKSDSKYLDNTSLMILGTNGNKVGSVSYDPKDGRILQVNIAFQVDEKGVRSE
jgi:hypothetical protein